MIIIHGYNGYNWGIFRHTHIFFRKSKDKAILVSLLSLKYVDMTSPRWGSQQLDRNHKDKSKRESSLIE